MKLFFSSFSVLIISSSLVPTSVTLFAAQCCSFPLSRWWSGQTFLIHWLVALYFHLPQLFLFSFLILHPLMSINPPEHLSLPIPFLTHFLLFKEEALDHLTQPVWTSHLPIILPVDRQPVTEGEILQSVPLLLFLSSFPSFPRWHHAWFGHCTRGGVNVTFTDFYCYFLSCVADAVPPKGSFPVKMP